MTSIDAVHCSISPSKGHLQSLIIRLRVFTPFGNKIFKISVLILRRFHIMLLNPLRDFSNGHFKNVLFFLFRCWQHSMCTRKMTEEIGPI